MQYREIKKTNVKTKQTNVTFKLNLYDNRKVRGW